MGHDDAIENRKYVYPIIFVSADISHLEWYYVSFTGGILFHY